MGKVRGRLNFANVVSVIALFVALGGTGLAASQLGKNTVGTKQLKKNAVTTAKIKKGAITTAKVKDGTLTGQQIDASTLGTVPNAVNAQSLGGLSADQIAQSMKLRCPAGTELAAGACFETAARPSAPFLGALETCASIDRSLPSPGQLAAFLLAKRMKGEQNWTGSFFFASEFRAASEVFNGLTINIGTLPITNQIPYRCVTQPGN